LWIVNWRYREVLGGIVDWQPTSLYYGMTGLRSNQYRIVLRVANSRNVCVSVVAGVVSVGVVSVVVVAVRVVSVVCANVCLGINASAK